MKKDTSSSLKIDYRKLRLKGTELKSMIEQSDMWKKLRPLLKLMWILVLQTLKVLSIWLCLEYFHSLTFVLRKISLDTNISHLLKPFIGAPIFWYICNGVWVLFAPKFLLSKNLGKILFHPLKCLLNYYFFRFVYRLVAKI